MHERTQWQLRYRSPLSPTRGVDDVVSETETDDLIAAQTLAEWWLDLKMPSPSTRFVYVRRLVVATSAEMRAALGPQKSVPEPEETGPSPVQAASRGTEAAPPQPLSHDEMSGDGGDAPRRGRGVQGRVGA